MSITNAKDYQRELIRQREKLQDQVDKLQRAINCIHAYADQAQGITAQKKVDAIKRIADEFIK